MAGNVYLFNVNAEEMSRVQVRNWPADETIDGWSEEKDDKYSPNALAVPREKFPTDSCSFAQGDNSVSFSRPTFNGAFILTIDPAISLSDDLICYVTRSSALLMRTNGEVISEVTFAPTLMADEGS
ncbi:hypothetical protein QTA57_02935 [Fontisubflavum oceani]|uniref:hypothetical protein n=1 Tax=Fontisubflavum oceani TaxID=2978973 RepID=UPI0025B2EF7B|nr:hypothetical protein [Fontisubflavum oceani]WJY22145.1 hypothetical protein QTA57_02935 [Fontisubflavum oceani]